MDFAKLTLFSKVRSYINLSKKLQIHLSKYPDDWPKLQKIFNSAVNKVYYDILKFERGNIERFESKVYRLKKIFEKRYRRYFLHGEFIRWSLKKPYGYAGDFKIIDDIYQNQPRTTGFERLWDNYFQQLDISKATRARKDDFKKIIVDFVKKRENSNYRIMDLASGPARIIKELLDADTDNLFSNVIFDCYDFDIRAINYAKKLLNNAKNVNFIQKNAIRLALKKDIKKEIPWNYDVIYCAGLFDYLDERTVIRLVGNLKRLIKKNGIFILLISNMSDKCNNPSASWMEWVADWNLIYRTETKFKKIFLDAGFSPENLQITPQHSKIMQYCLVKNTSNLKSLTN